MPGKKKVKDFLKDWGVPYEYIVDGTIVSAPVVAVGE
jgi:hypothetical protein